MTDGIIQKVFKRYFQEGTKVTTVTFDVQEFQQELIEEIKKEIHHDGTIWISELIGDNE